MDTSATVTPKELEQQIGVPAKTIRKWLRNANMRPLGEKGFRWNLSIDEAEQVRRQFPNGAARA